MKKLRKILFASALSIAGVAATSSVADAASAPVVVVSETPDIAATSFRPILHAPVWVWYRDPEGCQVYGGGLTLRCYGAGIRPESRTAPYGSYFVIGRHPVTGQYGVWLVYP